MALVVKFTLHFILPHIFACKSLTGRYCNLQIYSGVHTFHTVCYIFMTDKVSEHFTKCKPHTHTHTRTITTWHDISARHILAITCTFYYRLTGWQLVICMYSIIAPIGVCTSMAIVIVSQISRRHHWIDLELASLVDTSESMYVEWTDGMNGWALSLSAIVQSWNWRITLCRIRLTRESDAEEYWIELLYIKD